MKICLISLLMLCSLSLGQDVDTTRVAELKELERQGILEFPKQLASLIKNKFDENVDRVFPTPDANGVFHSQTFPPATLSSTKRPPPLLESTNPTLAAASGGDTAIGQHNVDNKEQPQSLSPAGVQIEEALSPVVGFEPASIPAEPAEVTISPQPEIARPPPPPPSSSALNPNDVEEYIYLINGGVPPPTTQAIFEPQEAVTPDPEDFDPGTATATVEPADVDVDVDAESTVAPVTEDIDVDLESSTLEPETEDVLERELTDDNDVFELLNQ